MMTLESFYDLINRNAQITLVNARHQRKVYIGSVKDIPDEYNACPVEDFIMDDRGHLTFQIKIKETTPVDRDKKLWKEGVLRVYDGIYHYWAKVYDEGSKYGIDEGRVSKLMIKRKGEIVCNYDRGWDVRPVDEETQLSMEIILHEYAG